MSQTGTIFHGRTVWLNSTFVKIQTSLWTDLQEVYGGIIPFSCIRNRNGIFHHLKPEVGTNAPAHNGLRRIVRPIRENVSIVFMNLFHSLISPVYQEAKLKIYTQPE